MSGRRLDDVFDPNRLRDLWVAEPVAPVLERPSDGPAVPRSIVALDAIATAIARDLPGREAAWRPMIEKLRKLLLAAEPKPGEKVDEKARAEVGEALESLEDLVEALMLVNG